MNWYWIVGIAAGWALAVLLWLEYKKRWGTKLPVSLRNDNDVIISSSPVMVTILFDNDSDADPGESADLVIKTKDLLGGRYIVGGKEVRKPQPLSDSNSLKEAPENDHTGPAPMPTKEPDWIPPPMLEKDIPDPETDNEQELISTSTINSDL